MNNEPDVIEIELKPRSLLNLVRYILSCVPDFYHVFRKYNKSRLLSIWYTIQTIYESIKLAIKTRGIK